MFGLFEFAWLSLALPCLALPRLALPCLASPRLAFPCLARNICVKLLFDHRAKLKQRLVSHQLRNLGSKMCQDGCLGLGCRALLTA